MATFDSHHLAYDLGATVRRLYNWLAGLFPDYVQAFCVSILVCNFVPLLPLLAEHAVSGGIKSDTWSVTAAMYAAGIGNLTQPDRICTLPYCSRSHVFFVWHRPGDS
jgi:hypothetical protein